MATEPARSLTLRIPTDHPAFAGHFPGQPLLPGVSLLAEVLEALLADATLAARLGPAPRLAQIVLDASGRGLRFEVRDLTAGARLAASGQFEAAAP
jgi:3-hydroxyacyl-[acyl-carrier-protein] dehydratase